MRPRYTVVLSDLAQRFLSKLTESDRRLGAQVVRALEKLEEHPDLGEPLAGEWKGYFKYRSGRYRVLYRAEYHRLLVYVIKIGDRKNVYD